MSARDEILASVRAALAAVEPMGDLPAPPVITPVDDLVSLFVERVTDYRAKVERCDASDLLAVVQGALGPQLSVVVPEGLCVTVPQAVGDAGLGAKDLDAIHAVVTEARLGIAETGTIVLDHGRGQGRRAISLVPDRHICIVRASQVVADVPDAIALLDPTLPLTWISGPSATSDIELDRVEGVHGPRDLHVIVVDDMSPTVHSSNTQRGGSS